MSVVLGIKTGEGHDSGAALVYERDGALRGVAISEERLSRVKHDGAFPRRAIGACLAHAGLGLGDVTHLCMDKLGDATSTLTHAGVETLGAGALDEAERGLVADARSARSWVVNHHLCHAASAFAVSGMASAAVLVVDGSGTRFPLGDDDAGLVAMGDASAPDDFPMAHYGRSAETQTVFHATRGPGGRPRYERITTSRKSGLGHFYTFFSRHVLGFGTHEEGKTMGLAAYGGPAGLPVFPAGVFAGIDTPLLEHCMAIGFRPPRRGVERDPTAREHADVAHWMQETLSEGMAGLARHAVKRTGERGLCLAGGVALNVVANRLVRDALTGEGAIDGVFVPPGASDTGTPLGAALYGYSELAGGSLAFAESAAYLGPAHDEGAAEAALVARGGRVMNDPGAEVAALLLSGAIVGWWQGRSEHGPRALGARSILCWPRPAWMKDHLNARVKHREAFRPFAPIVEEARAHEVFDCDFPVPYMLMNTMVREEFRERLPAVTHKDGSGRLQTVSAARTPRLHALLREVRARDGVGVLLNTSFNDSGEPIVETAQDAVRCFEGTAIDALVVGRALLVKSERGGAPGG